MSSVSKLAFTVTANACFYFIHLKYGPPQAFHSMPVFPRTAACETSNAPLTEENKQKTTKQKCKPPNVD